MFLYSSSNEASAINQLLTQTQAFCAAVSHGGVADWLGYYKEPRRLGDKTIASFLGGVEPEENLDLYRRISPAYHFETITTPLLQFVGENEPGFPIPSGSTMHCGKAGQPTMLVKYPDEGQDVNNAVVAEEHIQ